MGSQCLHVYFIALCLGGWPGSVLQHAQLLTQPVALLHQLFQLGHRDVGQVLPGHLPLIRRGHASQQGQLCHAGGCVFFHQPGGNILNHRYVVVGLPLADTHGLLGIVGEGLEPQPLVAAGVPHLFQLAAQGQQAAGGCLGGGHDLIVQAYGLGLFGGSVRCQGQLLHFIHGVASFGGGCVPPGVCI